MKNILSTLIGYLTALAVLVTTPAFGASSSWFETEGARLRLISLPSPDGKKLDAGLQIELEKGWKTYWRSPGASGLPPQLDFSGSRNIAGTAIDYPVPGTFGKNENLTAGYLNSVTLPISVEPLFAGRPITIKTSGIIGICREICVPVQFQLSLDADVTGGSTRDVASALFQSRSNLVKKATPNFSVKQAYVEGSQLLVEAAIPAGTTETTVMVEGPSDWYLTPAKADRINDTTALYRVNLADIPKTADPYSTELRFTLISGNLGVEQWLTPKKP